MLACLGSMTWCAGGTWGQGGSPGPTSPPAQHAAHLTLPPGARYSPNVVRIGSEASSVNPAVQSRWVSGWGSDRGCPVQPTALVRFAMRCAALVPQVGKLVEKYQGLSRQDWQMRWVSLCVPVGCAKRGGGLVGGRAGAVAGCLPALCSSRACAHRLAPPPHTPILSPGSPQVPGQARARRALPARGGGTRGLAARGGGAPRPAARAGKGAAPGRAFFCVLCMCVGER